MVLHESFFYFLCIAANVVRMKDEQELGEIFLSFLLRRKLFRLYEKMMAASVVNTDFRGVSCDAI